MEGCLFGSYRIVRLLGEGAMGAVYEALHTIIGRRAAVKILRPHLAGNPAILQRFFSEARASSLIEHPGLVEVFEVGQKEDGTTYMIMEYLRGETLGSRIAALGGLDVPTICRLGRQVAETIAAAHQRRIIHRDLKPDNIMIIPDPEAPCGERTKVLDFGIAKLAAELTSSDHATESGLIMGTPAYMSPEQCRGASLVDSSTDVYSLGIILYQMLTGRLPFSGETPGDYLLAHMTLEPPPLAALRTDVPAHLAMFIHQMLRKDRALRPAMNEVAATLARASAAQPLRHSLPPAEANSQKATVVLRLTPQRARQVPWRYVLPVLIMPLLIWRGWSGCLIARSAGPVADASSVERVMAPWVSISPVDLGQSASANAAPVDLSSAPPSMPEAMDRLATEQTSTGPTAILPSRQRDQTRPVRPKVSRGKKTIPAWLLKDVRRSQEVPGL